MAHSQLQLLLYRGDCACRPAGHNVMVSGSPGLAARLSLHSCAFVWGARTQGQQSKRLTAWLPGLMLKETVAPCGPSTCRCLVICAAGAAAEAAGASVMQQIFSGKAACQRD